MSNITLEDKVESVIYTHAYGCFCGDTHCPPNPCPKFVNGSSDLWDKFPFCANCGAMEDQHQETYR